MFGQVLGRNRVFLVLCHDKGPLCRDMALRLDAMARSQYSFSMLQQCFASLS